VSLRAGLDAVARRNKPLPAPAGNPSPVVQPTILVELEDRENY